MIYLLHFSFSWGKKHITSQLWYVLQLIYLHDLPDVAVNSVCAITVHHTNIFYKTLKFLQFLPSEISDGGDKHNHPFFERKEFVGAQVSDGERFFQITTFCCLALHDEHTLPLEGNTVQMLPMAKDTIVLNGKQSQFLDVLTPSPCKVCQLVG